MIGLGLAALGRPGYINLGHHDDLAGGTDVAAMERRCHRVLDAAFAGGVRWFDAARSYGRAEEFLASWLRARKLAPGAVTISSKWGYTYTAGWQAHAEKHEVKDHTLPTLRRQLAESRALLGAHLDVYQVHSATLDSGILDDRAVLDELSRVRAAGLRIGLSTTGPEQAAVIRRALTLGIFDTVQSTWNLLERSAGAALAEAHDAGLRVIIKEALANGRLTARNPDPALAPLVEHARSLAVPVDALALAAALAQPFADVVLSGATTTAQLADNLRATEITAPGDFLTLVEPAREYWRTRAALPWN